MFCTHCIEAALTKLAQSDPKLNISNAKKLLIAAWSAKKVDFIDSDGSIHGRTFLENALSEPFTVRLVFEVECKPDASPVESVEQSDERHNATDAVSKQKHVPGAFRSNALTERFVREMDLQERRRGFVWIGYVAKTMLPSFGLDERESQAFIERVESEGVISRSQHPNPKNPDYPSTGVMLNREHPFVDRVLANGVSQAGRDPLHGGRSRVFRPIKISGGPLSDDIIRDRR